MRDPRLRFDVFVLSYGAFAGDFVLWPVDFLTFF